MPSKAERLCSAARNNNIKLIEELLNEGVSIEARDKEGRTPLLWALNSGSQNAIKLLLEKSANVKACANDGRGALHELLRGHHRDSTTVLTNITLLIDRGVDVNGKTEKNETPLHCTSSLSHGAAYASLLIEKGADMNAKTKEGQTPLHVAIQWGGHSSSLPALLIEKGVDVTARDNKGRTPLHYVVSRWARGQESIVALLLRQGADINARDKNGSTALHDAVRHGSSEQVLLLMQCGANITILDSAGRTPLDLAKEKGETVCQALLQSTVVVSHPEVSPTTTSGSSESQGQSTRSRLIPTIAPSQESGSKGPSASARSAVATATIQESGEQVPVISLGALAEQTIIGQLQQITSLKQSLVGQSQQIDFLTQTVSEQSQQIDSLIQTVSQQSQQIALLKQSLPKQPPTTAPLPRVGAESMTEKLKSGKRRGREPLPLVSTTHGNERRPNQTLSEQSWQMALLPKQLQQPPTIAPLPRVRSESMMTDELTANSKPAKRRRREPLPLVSTTYGNERRPNPMALFNTRNTLPPEREVVSSTGERVEVPPNISITSERTNPRANLQSQKKVILLSDRESDTETESDTENLPPHVLKSPEI